MDKYNALICAMAAAVLDISALVLILTAYSERRTSRRHWNRQTGGLVLAVGDTLYPLTCDEVIIGRHASADIRIPDPSVSRYHALLTFSGSCWEIHDNNSKSGVYVNGQLVESAMIREGDVISVGTYRIYLRRGGKND